MKKNVIKMTLEQIIELLNESESDLSTAGRPPYIQKNNEDARDKIGDYLGYGGAVMNACGRGRYSARDEYIIFDAETDTIFTFSNKEDLFDFLPASVIQRWLDENNDENGEDENPAIACLIQNIDKTFAKDDIKSVDRMVLENLILYIYDSLHHLNGSFPDWWDREN